jgi:hypothetical protein
MNAPIACRTLPHRSIEKHQIFKHYFDNVHDCIFTMEHRDAVHKAKPVRKIHAGRRGDSFAEIEGHLVLTRPRQNLWSHQRTPLYGPGAT